MTVGIAAPITADASFLVTLHAGTSCEQGVNGQLTTKPRQLLETDLVATLPRDADVFVQEDRFLVLVADHATKWQALGQ